MGEKNICKCKYVFTQLPEQKARTWKYVCVRLWAHNNMHSLMDTNANAAYCTHKGNITLMYSEVTLNVHILMCKWIHTRKHTHTHTHVTQV